MDLKTGNKNEYLVSHYDARRFDWKRIWKFIKVAPRRFYTRPNLTSNEVEEIRDMFREQNLPVPVVGFYSEKKEDRFFVYD